MGFSSIDDEVFRDEAIGEKVEQAIRIIDRELQKGSIDAEQGLDWKRQLNFRLSDRKRIYIPSTDPKSLNKIREPFREQPELAALFHDIGQALYTAAKKSKASKDFGAAFRLSFQALAFDPNIDELRKDLQSSIQALTQKKVMNRVPSNLPELNWKSGSYASVTTTHFEILSRAPSKQSGNLAELCEQTYCAWQQLFFDFWSPEGPAQRKETKRFRVILFKNREEYLSQLRQLEPNIGVSTGYYSPKLRMAFFYWDEQKSLATMRHELVHQFFAEASARPNRLDVDNQPGIWAVEGVAMYFESLTKIADSGLMDTFEVGGWDAPRLQSARYRRLRDEYWIPWEEFHGETGQRLRQRDDIAMYYSQAAGITHWLMDGDAESENQFHDYLRTVYDGATRGRLQPGTPDDSSILSKYDPFLLVDPSIVEQRQIGPGRTEIVLARTAIQSRHLLSWPAELRKLKWLDVSFTQIDDSLFCSDVGSPWSIVRLTLEETQITDQSLAEISKMASLEELDLSHCQISDEGLTRLRGLSKLRILWLSNTPITNDSFETLRTLKSLEQLEVTGTEMDEETKDKLRKALPKWKSP